jgi:hypothetical protein
MGVSNEGKNGIPLKFLRKIKNLKKFPLVNSLSSTQSEDIRYFSPHIRIFDMDVKNVTVGILIFIVRDKISITKILNVSHYENKT